MSGVALRELPAPSEDGPSWSEVLRLAVRAEFQVEVYRPRPGDLVLFGATCAVHGCPGHGVNRSPGLEAKGARHSTGTAFRGYLCQPHVDMWRRDGEPEIDAWVRHGARAPRGQALPDRCQAGGCPRSARGAGFCGAHKYRWERAGQSQDRAGFAANAPAVPVAEQLCVVVGCCFPVIGHDGFCDGHLQRYRNAKHCRRGLTPAGYLEHLAAARRSGAPKFDMRGLPAVVQLELQFALQSRQEAGKAAMGQLIFGQVVRWVADLGVESVLERSEAFWVRSATERFRTSVRANPLGWLRYVRHRVQRLRERQSGVEVWSFDTWPVEALDVDGRYAHQPARRVYFAEIDPLWLRELVKRWARWRIMAATKSPASIACSASSIRRFCRWAEDAGVALSSPAVITRALLERYLAWVRTLNRSVGRKSSLITDLKVFPDDVRLHDWAPGLASSATFYYGERQI